MIGVSSTRADRPMLDRNIKPTFADLLEDEFAQEKASALGRLGQTLEAKLAAQPGSTPAWDAKRHPLHSGNCVLRWSPRPVPRSGISQCNARPVGFATCVTCSATTAFRRRSLPAWAPCRSTRHRRASRTAGYRALLGEADTSSETGPCDHRLCQLGFCAGGPMARPTIFPPPVSVPLKPARIPALPAELGPPIPL